MNQGGCPNVIQSVPGAGDKLFRVSIAHRPKEEEEVAMTGSGELLDGRESGSSVDGDITQKACVMGVTRAVP